MITPFQGGLMTLWFLMLIINRPLLDPIVTRTTTAGGPEDSQLTEFHKCEINGLADYFLTNWDL
jgi:hypothetical protein